MRPADEAISSVPAREEVDNLETQVLSAESQVELTKAQLIQMEARRDNARIRLDHTEIRSPFTGYVSRRFVDRGALVSANTPLVEIVDGRVIRAKVIKRIPRKLVIENREKNGEITAIDQKLGEFRDSLAMKLGTWPDAINVQDGTVTDDQFEEVDPDAKKKETETEDTEDTKETESK